MFTILVCHFWKTVVEKQWEKIVEISYNKGSSKVIPAKDALKIVQQAARFCKVLKSYTSLNEHQVVYIFGSKSGWEWHYKFEGFSIFNVLEVLAENAKEITEVHFPESPRTYLLGDLINSNKVKTVSVVNPDELWQNIPTDGIENLDISIDSSRHFESFKGVCTINFINCFITLYFDFCFLTTFKFFVCSTFETCKG